MSPRIADYWHRYGVLGTLRLARDVLATRLWFPGARIVRHPWYIRGQGAISLGREFTAGVGLRMDAFGSGPAQIVIGDRVQVGDYCHIAAVESVVLEDDVLIASRVYISDHNHGRYSGPLPHSRPAEVQYARPLSVSPVHIGANVWLGEGVMVLPGVTIGANSVIGAGAVVTRSLPADCVAVGNPARVIKSFDAATQRWTPTALVAPTP
jgi:lipopolysaccharide O-acetyltransferase